MNRTNQNKKVDRLPSGTSAADGNSGNDLPEFPVQTLFDRIKEKKAGSSHNIVIIGRLRDTWDKQPELGDFYQEFISSKFGTASKRADNSSIVSGDEKSGQSVTGLLLIFPTLFVHYLEVTNSAMKIILEDLNNSIHNQGLIREALILNIAYNINVRLYPNWSFKSIKLAVEDLDAQPAETTDVIALEVLGKLLRLARFQAEERQKQERPTDVFSALEHQRADLLPNQVNINFLLKQEIFRTPEDILRNYKRPVHIRFESDLTAPPTHRLFPISF